MRKNLIATAVACVIAFAGAPCFADGHAVNGYSATPAEMAAIASNASQPNSRPVHPPVPAAAVAQTAGQKCYYVLDVLLCD